MDFPAHDAKNTNNFKGLFWYALGESNPCLRRERAEVALSYDCPTLISFRNFALSYDKPRQIARATGQLWGQSCGQNRDQKQSANSIPERPPVAEKEGPQEQGPDGQKDTAGDFEHGLILQNSGQVVGRVVTVNTLHRRQRVPKQPRHIIQ